jgi:hypothetical protein
MKSVIYSGLAMVTFCALTIIALQYVPSWVGITCYECTGSCDWNGHEMPPAFAIIMSVFFSGLAVGIVSLIIYYLSLKIKLIT